MLALLVSRVCFCGLFFGEGGYSTSESVMDKSCIGAGGPCRLGDSRGTGATTGDILP